MGIYEIITYQYVYVYLSFTFLLWDTQLYVSSFIMRTKGRMIYGSTLNEDTAAVYLISKLLSSDAWMGN